jgi:heptosyltransferase-2
MLENYLDMIRILGFKYNTISLEELTVSDEIKKKIDGFIKKNTRKKIIVGITPGVAETVKSRMWFEDRFALLADRIIKELNADVIFIDSPDNKKTVENIISMMKNRPIDASGNFSLYETFYLIKKCNVFISNDTGPMHIAAAQGCKTIGLFGPNTPVLWAPFGKGNISIYKTKLPPSIQNDKGTFEEGNREEYMGPISIDDVFSAVKKLSKKQSF